MQLTTALNSGAVVTGHVRRHFIDLARNAFGLTRSPDPRVAGRRATATAGPHGKTRNGGET